MNMLAFTIQFLAGHLLDCLALPSASTYQYLDDHVYHIYHNFFFHDGAALIQQGGMVWRRRNFCPDISVLLKHGRKILASKVMLVTLPLSGLGCIK